MKTTLMTIALAAASLPMFAAQATPANPPAAGTTATKPAVKAKKHHKTAKVKKTKTATPAPAAK
jgi:hypothetical protein